MKYTLRVLTLISILKPEYHIIVNRIKDIDFNSFIKLSNSFGTDVYRCELEYGDINNSITLKTCSPTYNTKERELQDYVNICNLILKAAQKGNLESIF